MAGEVKAIETSYMGCRFRSRLEARWAVFFDALGWTWEYEKQGYKVGWHEDDEIAWLPDFEVITPSGQHFYVEVKGDRSFFTNGDWLARFDFNGGPPGFPNCGWSNQFDKDHKPLLLLGDIPRFDSNKVAFYAPVIVHYKGVQGHLGQITREGIRIEFSFHWAHLDSGNIIEDFQVIPANSYIPDYAVNHAMRTALGARFEHGEKPKTFRSEQNGG